MNQQIEEARARYRQAAERQRQEMEMLVGAAHRAALSQLQERHAAQVKVLDDERRRLKEDMNRTLDLEREKIRAA